MAVVPPGEAASSISPTASAGARPKPLAIRKQINGSSRIWQARPISTGLGNFTTRAKSARVRVSPRPSMMKPRAMGRKALSKGDAVMAQTLKRGDVGQCRKGFQYPLLILRFMPSRQ
ncbi:hypothetical protein D9M71_635040 [compost metagenome]